MAAVTEVRVPDLGEFADVPVIEVLVATGDAVSPEDPLIVLESEKATMEVPAPAGGVVGEISVKVGDEVSQGDLILTLSGDGDAGGEPESAAGGDEAEDEGEAPGREAGAGEAADGEPDGGEAPGREPDAGEAADGEPDGREAPGREPDAGVDADASRAGREADEEPRGEEAEADRAAAAADEAPAEDAAASDDARERGEAPDDGAAADGGVYAGPGARRLARELGVNLADVRGSGRKGRVTKEDVEAHAGRGGAREEAPARAPSGDLPPWPNVDFARFGPVETVELSRIRRIAGPRLARNWALIPHVTQHDEADVTELEAFRKEVNAAHAEEGVKVTMVALVLKACAAALRAFPEVNSSLDGDRLVLKRYCHLGFAVDTPDGLLVPVVRDVDRKGLLEIARELADLSGTAREGSLKSEQMEGGTFTVTSLGGIGGTAFTPIINAPEVAILGVSRMATRPVWTDGDFRPRLMLPLSLSYDHRVVDGATAVRFTTHLAGLLADPRRMLL